MDQIVFKDIKLKVSPFDVLKKNRCISTLSRDFLNVAFKHGGYVAGGFARLVARHMLGLVDTKLYNGDTVEMFCDAINAHLGHGDLPKSNVSNFRNAGKGDIDVWFPDYKSLSEFENSPELKQILTFGAYNVYSSPSVTNCATEYVFQERVRIQVIKSWVMPRHEQLSRFDIYNAMCALDNESYTVPEHWEALERANMLHVTSWKSPWTVTRVFKYMNRKGYKHITPETCSYMHAAALDAIEFIRKNPKPNDDQLKELSKRPCGQLGRLDLRQISHRLKKLLPQMTNAQLLELSMYMGNNSSADYDPMMKILIDRIPVNASSLVMK